jgi:hypothetical protein
MCQPFTRFQMGSSWSVWTGPQYRWHKQKPYYEIRFAVLKPRHLTGCFMTGRLFCTARAMWKLIWFLRDFGYDSELLAKNEIDDKTLVDLWGVVSTASLF